MPDQNGPWQLRVGDYFEDALFSEEVDPVAMEWWFTEPEGALSFQQPPLAGSSERSSAELPSDAALSSTLMPALIWLA